MIADSGIIIRTHLDTIPSFSRTSQGVKIMKLRNNAKIKGVAITVKDEEDNKETTDETSLTENTENNQTEVTSELSQENVEE